MEQVLPARNSKNLKAIALHDNPADTDPPLATKSLEKATFFVFSSPDGSWRLRQYKMGNPFVAGADALVPRGTREVEGLEKEGFFTDCRCVS